MGEETSGQWLMPSKTTRREELGAFLRSRRERLRPDELGIRSHGRRRTPGLRREEVCDRAKLGLSWYTWLEQGREVTITPDTLLDVTFALALSDDETTFAFELAELQPPRRPFSITLEVPAHLQTMIDCMELTPAYILNGRWDRIAWNRGAVKLLGDFAQDAPKFRNSIWKTFNNPAARQTVDHWEDFAQVMLAEFQASRSRYLQEPWMEEFIEELMQASPDFSEWWAKREVSYDRDKKITIRRGAETLTFHHSSFHLSWHSDLTIVIFTPDPDTDTLNWVKRVTALDEDAE